MFRTRNIFVLITVACCLFWGANVSPAVSPVPKNALAIFNLRPTNIEAMGHNGDILYALISALEGDKTIKLMSRREMEEILFERFREKEKQDEDEKNSFSVDGDGRGGAWRLPGGRRVRNP